MLVLEIGNTHAIESYYDEEDGTLKFGLMQPELQERITTLRIPDAEEMTAEVLLKTVLHALRRHIHPEHGPDWIECSDEGLQHLLLTHFRLPEKAGERPPTWGRLNSGTRSSTRSDS